MTAQRSRGNKIAYKMTFTGVKPAIVKPASADNSKNISFFEGKALAVEAAGENVMASQSTRQEDRAPQRTISSYGMMINACRSAHTVVS